MEEIESKNYKSFNIYDDNIDNEGCDYCKRHGHKSTIVKDTHRLYFKKENNSYINIELLTGGSDNPRIRFSSVIENKKNGCFIEISYCPFCGRKL